MQPPQGLEDRGHGCREVTLRGAASLNLPFSLEGSQKSGFLNIQTAQCPEVKFLPYFKVRASIINQTTEK